MGVKRRGKRFWDKLCNFLRQALLTKETTLITNMGSERRTENGLLVIQPLKVAVFGESARTCGAGPHSTPVQRELCI